jgi:hypothetical protein
MVALTFRPVRAMLFPPEEIKEYPLICSAEAYKDPNKAQLIVDFYVINRTGEELTGEKLHTLLETLNLDPHRNPSPDIELEYSRRVGEIVSAKEDRKFNDTKGRLIVETYLDQEPKLVSVAVDYITPRALLKARIVISGLPELENKDLEIHRSSMAAIPFNVSEYMMNCFKQN